MDTAEETNRSERKTRRQKSVAEPEPEEDVDAELADEEGAEEQLAAAMAPTKMKAKRNDADSDSTFVGDPIPPEEAAQRWPKRYQVNPSSPLPIPRAFHFPFLVFISDLVNSF